MKRSDHLILEHGDTGWTAFIIEMKTTVDTETWIGIKQKTRATVLCAYFIADTLGIKIDNIVAVTTYEKERFDKLSDPTSPQASIPKLGMQLDDFKHDEWNKSRIMIKFDSKQTSFKHKRVQMQRGSDGWLYGEISADDLVAI